MIDARYPAYYLRVPRPVTANFHADGDHITEVAFAVDDVPVYVITTLGGDA